MFEIINKRQIEKGLSQGDKIVWTPISEIATVQGQGESIYEVAYIFPSDYPMRTKRILVVKSSKRNGKVSAIELDRLLKFNPYGIKFNSESV